MNKLIFLTLFLLSNSSTLLISSPFTDNTDGTITDQATGLIWQKCSVGLSGTNCENGTASNVTWAQSLQTCNSLNLSSKKWRLPTRFELITLLDFTSANPAINEIFFPNTSSSLYWTSASNNNYAVVVNFNHNFTYGMNSFISSNLKNNSNKVRCVTP